jgi:DNA-binding transcriptional LysR family regulator
MLQMARNGTAIAQLPCVLGDPDPLLRRVPARYVEPGWGLWVLSHVDLRSTARVRIFRDYLVDALEQQRDLIEGKLYSY